MSFDVGVSGAYRRILAHSKVWRETRVLNDAPDGLRSGSLAHARILCVRGNAGQHPQENEKGPGKCCSHLYSQSKEVFCGNGATGQRLKRWRRTAFIQFLYLTVWLYTFAPCLLQIISVPPSKRLPTPRAEPFSRACPRVRHRLPSWRLPSA